jgi:pimeloyl-ACP methyl ester carboxylesterase
MISAEDFESYTKLLPNAPTLTIPAARHLPNMEQPEAPASTVRTFLEN